MLAALLLECWKLTHDPIILVPLADDVEPVCTKEAIYLCVDMDVPSSMIAKFSRAKNSLITLETR